jgi:hypothetical protein
MKIGRGDNLHEPFEIEGIGDRKTCALDGACANRAQEFVSRVRRAEIGIHPNLAGASVFRCTQADSGEDKQRVGWDERSDTIAWPDHVIPA